MLLFNQILITIDYIYCKSPTFVLYRITHFCAIENYELRIENY